MIKLCTCDDTIQAGHLQSVLEAAGIDCWIKNLSLAGGIGEWPATECWPEIWLHREEDYELAMSIISPILSPPATRRTSWRCRCGEQLEGQFDLCWSCGRQRPQ